ncbi:helix-turn-helix domain-containing protein [Streptomyces erythrochromogenes]|uniref:helix-turn-helix domain-containing protein n=1 Tax=Streptomyces erythrochromogenes TaxID=285574 RepID=UPI00362B616C
MDLADTARRRCQLDGCERVHRGHGFCELHLARLKRSGTTDAPPAATLADRFWAKVDKRGPTDCWLWTAAVNEHGYGVMRPERQRTGPTVKAHRVSLTLAGVEINGRSVLHSCDTPRCVNPAHLSPGDQKANIAEMVSRQRQARGSRNGYSKLTEVQVAEIRSLAEQGVRTALIADQFGVSDSTIYRVVNRQGWRHVA